MLPHGRLLLPALMNVAQRHFAASLLPACLGNAVPRLAYVVLGLLLAAAMVIAGRRLAIGQWEPVPLRTTLAAAVVLLAVASAIRWAAAPRLRWWVPSLVILAWAAACSLPAAGPLAWCLWGAAVATDGLVGRQLSSRRTAAADPRRCETPAEEPHGAAEHFPPIAEGETVLQHVVRVRDSQQREYVHATLRADFAPGERHTTLYLGFCPPFATVPQVEAELIEGPPGVAKVVQALHNGAQIEVDLDAPSLDAVHVTVEVAAYPAAGA